MLHICGENLENSHDAIHDTVALRKIAEYGAASQGKNFQKLSICNEFIRIRCFHQFELIQTTFIFIFSNVKNGFFQTFFFWMTSNFVRFHKMLNQIFAVNFNCLSYWEVRNPHPFYNFGPNWTSPFIAKIVLNYCENNMFYLKVS